MVHLRTKGDLVLVFGRVGQEEEGACLARVLGEGVVEDKSIVASFTVWDIVSPLVEPVCFTLAQLHSLLQSHLLKFLHHFWLTVAWIFFIATRGRREGRKPGDGGERGKRTRVFKEPQVDRAFVRLNGP